VDTSVHNNGLNTETSVEVFLLANSSGVDSKTISSLPNGAYESVLFYWTPTAEGLYNVTVYVLPEPGEYNTADNVASSWVRAVVYELSSDRPANAVTVDGYIHENEWQDAYKKHIYLHYENEYGPFIEYDLYVKNDGEFLYLAADGLDDLTDDPAKVGRLAFLFDVDYDKKPEPWRDTVYGFERNTLDPYYSVWLGTTWSIHFRINEPLEMATAFQISPNLVVPHWMYELKIPLQGEESIRTDPGQIAGIDLNKEARYDVGNLWPGLFCWPPISTFPLWERPPLVLASELMPLCVRGLDDRIYYRFYASSSGSWGDWDVVPSGATGDGPAAAVLGNELHLVVRGMDGSTLWHGTINLTDNTFSGWNSLSGATPSAPTLTSNGTVLCLVVRGLDYRIYHRYYEDDSWGPWYAVPTGATCDSPAAAMLEDNLYIVVRGMDGTSLWHIIVGCDGTVVRDWIGISGATSSRPVLTPSESSNKLYLVVRGLDDRIYYRDYTASGDSWGSWNPLPTGATCDGPGATLIGSVLRFVVRGMDGNSIWHGYLTDPADPESFTGWTPLSGATPSAPTLTG
jgi:hypothetical protein